MHIMYVQWNTVMEYCYIKLHVYLCQRYVHQCMYTHILVLHRRVATETSWQPLTHERQHVQGEGILLMLVVRDNVPSNSQASSASRIPLIINPHHRNAQGGMRICPYTIVQVCSIQQQQ